MLLFVFSSSRNPGRVPSSDCGYLCSVHRLGMAADGHSPQAGRGAVVGTQGPF